MHPNVAMVIRAGRNLGLDVVAHEFPQSTRTAAEAAAAIGVEPAQIVKSLVFVVDDDPVIALIGGDRRLDETKLAAAAGGQRCRRPGADEVRSVTGFAVGGIPPFGHAVALRSFVDRALLEHPEVWAAAGTPHVNFPINPRRLAAATKAVATDLAADVAPEA
ncbi:MAG: YbaK/EbsC family protein [Acidimicrobiales bacterium]